MRLVKSFVEALAILGAVVSIVGGTLFFVVFSAAAAQKVGVWLFPVTILGAYLIFVFAVYKFHKGVKKNEVPRVGTNRPDVTRASSLVKLDDLTVSRAIQESTARRLYVKPEDAFPRTPDDAA